MFARRLAEARTDKVATMTIPYAAPEAMSLMVDRAVLLDTAMDVWSLAIVLMQAITRLTDAPTEGDVRHLRCLVMIKHAGHFVSLDRSAC